MYTITQKKEKKTVSSTDVDSAFVVNNKGFVDGKFTYELGKNKSIAELKKSQIPIPIHTTATTALW